MISLFSEFARFLRLVIVGLLVIVGALVLLAGGFLRARGDLTRQRLEGAVAVLRDGPPAPPPSGKPEGSLMPDDVAMTKVGYRLEAERLDLRELQMSQERTTADLLASQRKLDEKWDEYKEQKRRAEAESDGSSARGVRGRSESPFAVVSPAVRGSDSAKAAADTPDAGESFARAARVAARTDPRSLASRMLTWTAPGDPGRASAGPAPNYDEILRYLRALNDSQAAEVLEEMARLTGPGGDREFGLRIAGELHRRMGQ